MARNWNLQQRRDRALDARRWRPWHSSTGPTTAQGLAKTRFNATKNGTLTREAIALNRAVAAFLADI